MGFTVEQIQPTPNPNAVKFLLYRPITQQPRSFFDAESAKAHSVASDLFAIEGVSSLLLLGDFVTVNKTHEASWKQITPKVRRVLSEVADSPIS